MTYRVATHLKFAKDTRISETSLDRRNLKSKCEEVANTVCEEGEKGVPRGCERGGSKMDVEVVR